MGSPAQALFSLDYVRPGILAPHGRTLAHRKSQNTQPNSHSGYPGIRGLLRDRITHAVLRKARLKHAIPAAQVSDRDLGFLVRGIFVGVIKYVFALVTMSFY